MENYVYIVECDDHTYYTGWTNNLQKRIADHNSGNGARYTSGRRPVVLRYYETFATKQEAMRREYEIKKFTREAKQALIDNFHKKVD